MIIVDFAGFLLEWHLGKVLHRQPVTNRKKHTTMTLKHWLAALALAAFAAPAGAQDADLQEASRLLRQGQQAQALDRVNQILSSRPRDAQARFLKGLILTEQNKAQDAIEVFTRLTQDFPELPEPYNNLAVLYAAQGQYEKARQSLEMSIRTHPSYATAYENLGDVYTKLASQAYDKALQLDSSNTGAQGKLSLIRDLMSSNRAPRTTSVASAKGAVPSEPARQAAAVAAAPAAKAPAAAPVPAQVAPAPDAKADAMAQPKPAVPEAAGRDDVIKAVRAWAAAWSAKDVDGYLAAYARDFKTPGGEARGDWEKARRQRITAPKSIDVQIEAPKVTMKDADTASVTFRQSYKSDSLKANSTKTLELGRLNGRWLIRQERVGN